MSEDHGTTDDRSGSSSGVLDPEYAKSIGIATEAGDDSPDDTVNNTAGLATWQYMVLIGGYSIIAIAAGREAIRLFLEWRKS